MVALVNSLTSSRGPVGGSLPAPDAPTPAAPLGPRALALELVGVTVAAAVAASAWTGRARPNDADGAAVGAMRAALGRLPLDGVVVIGEGEKDQAPLLANGERVGRPGSPLAVDVAVDPVEGTSALAAGLPGAIATIAVAPRGALFDPGPSFYMDKLVVPAVAADTVDPTAPVPARLAALARSLQRRVDELTVWVLDKPRHRDLVAEIRRCGAAVAHHRGGDVVGALSVGPGDDDVHALMGVGGTPEGVLAAAALVATGGALFGRLAPRSDIEASAVAAAGLDTRRWFGPGDLVAGDEAWFCATGITGGELVDRLRWQADSVTAQSLVTIGSTGEHHLVTSRVPRHRCPVPGSRVTPGDHRTEEAQRP